MFSPTPTTLSNGETNMRRIIGSVGTSFTALTLALIIGVGLAAAQAKPSVAVLEFKNKANNQWISQGGAEAIQDAFITEMIKLGKFKVMEVEQIEDMMMKRNLTLSGEIDAKTAVKVGSALGVSYLLVGAVTEYGSTGSSGGGLSAGKRTFVATLNSQLIETKTGKTVWSGAESSKTDSIKVSVGGFGSGVDGNRTFDKVMKPAILNLIAKLKAADPVK